MAEKGDSESERVQKHTSQSKANFQIKIWTLQRLLHTILVKRIPKCDMDRQPQHRGVQLCMPLCTYSCIMWSSVFSKPPFCTDQPAGMVV